MKINNLFLSQFILSILRPYRFWIAILILVGFCWALISTLIPYVLKLTIDHIVSFKGASNELLQSAQLFFLIYIVLWVGLCFCMRLLDWVKMKLFPKIREDIINRMYKYIALHSHSYFQTNLTGSLANKINELHRGIISILSTLDALYIQLLIIVLTITSIFFTHPFFALILLAWIASFSFITAFFLKPIRNFSQAFAESVTNSMGKIIDSISNINNVKLFARHKEESNYIHQSIRESVVKDQTMQSKIIKMRFFWDLTILALAGLNFYILITLYIKNMISIGDFSFVMSVSINMLWSLSSTTSQVVAVYSQIGNCKQAFVTLNKPHAIVDEKNAKPLVVAQGKIEFKEVTFCYEGEPPLFQNQNVIIPPGQKVGITGSSGSGKSSFISLILRLFDVESGIINIDGQNIKHVTQQSLREQIAFIPQDVTLFHRTVMDNIRIGNINASDEEIIAISKKAHCHEFIINLQNGYQTLVGERGTKLSGGQRQRIAIARAMLKNAPILILDEATSALDLLTERYIQKAFDEIMINKTTIVIAHRLSTLLKMDRILIFERGKIIGDGPPDNLIKHGVHHPAILQVQI